MTRTISRFAKELSIDIETIRFYVHKGLISATTNAGFPSTLKSEASND